MKKILLLSLFSLLFFGSASKAYSVSTSTPKTVYIFSSSTCPHCAAAKAFLNDFQDQNSIQFTIQDYEFSEHIEKVQKYYEKYEVPLAKRGFVPAIFIDDTYYIGFGPEIEAKIRSHLLSDAPLPETKTKVSFFGTINLKELSLPVLAVTLGIADGFNVCSLGALMIILGLVMVFRSRKKMFFLGGTFIATTGLVYGLMIVLWHQLFSRIAPYLRNIEIVIGAVTLFAGLYLLREFYKAYKDGPICSSNNLMSRLTPKVERIFKSNASVVALMGSIAMFAAVVTIVEFPCSAVLPVVFAGLLVNANISLELTFLYMTLYMVMYLLDEIILFTIAVATLKIKVVSPRWIVFFNLAAACIFIFLGMYYLFFIVSS